MKGKYKVIVQNNRLHYELEIRRNITIIQGNSATGKTTLVNMLRQAENLGNSSGIDVQCDVPCRILEGTSWKLILENSQKTIFFIDEENVFMNTEEFASAVRKSDNYVVLMTRENLYNLPYSVGEIYGLHSSGKYQNTRKVYQQMSAEGKSNIYFKLNGLEQKEVCVIADGAAIGPEMNRLYEIVRKKKRIHLYLPESFEWLVLSSGLIEGKDIENMLEEPEKYIDSKEYFSWERYFTKVLVDRTQDSYLQYRKAKLNAAYLHERNKRTILKSIRGIEF